MWDEAVSRVRSVKPALMVIFGGQDCLFWLLRGIPPAIAHEKR